MMIKKLFPTLRMFGGGNSVKLKLTSTDKSELDRPIHRPCCHGRKKNGSFGDNNIPLDDDTIDCTIDRSCMSELEIDITVHIRPQPSLLPRNTKVIDCSETG